MDYIPLIALGVSGIALVISGLGFWLSWRSQYHTQIVSFEQRKQEMRQIFLGEQLTVIEIEGEMRRFPDSEWRGETMSQLAGIRQQNETFLKDLDRIPSSPSTEARLKLEDLAGKVIVANNSLRTLLKVVHDAHPSTSK